MSIPSSQQSQTEHANKVSQNTICHSERKKPLALSEAEGEESLISASQTLRFAQGDSFEIVSKCLLCYQLSAAVTRFPH
ncbi:hypothetical protein ES703_76676 [subsurface metagenome]